MHEHVKCGAQRLAPRLRQVRQHGADQVNRHNRARVVRRLLRARSLRCAVHLHVRSRADQSLMSSLHIFAVSLPGSALADSPGHVQFDTISAQVVRDL